MRYENRNGNAQHSLAAAQANHDWDAIDIPVTAPVLVRLCAASAALCTEYVFVPEAAYPLSCLLDGKTSTVSVAISGDTVTLTNMPQLSDIKSMNSLLETMGTKIDEFNDFMDGHETKKIIIIQL